jgi:hypothetical protein
VIHGGSPVFAAAVPRNGRPYSLAPSSGASGYFA